MSIAEIAERADCFPSQIVYYFGDKEALFVEVACRDILTARDAVEAAARGAGTPASAVHDMVVAATGSEAILGFVEAMLLARRRQDLQPAVRAAFASLHTEAERAATEILAGRRTVLRWCLKPCRRLRHPTIEPGVRPGPARSCRHCRRLTLGVEVRLEPVSTRGLEPKRAPVADVAVRPAARAASRSELPAERLEFVG